MKCPVPGCQNQRLATSICESCHKRLPERLAWRLYFTVKEYEHNYKRNPESAWTRTACANFEAARKEAIEWLVAAE